MNRREGELSEHILSLVSLKFASTNPLGTYLFTSIVKSFQPSDPACLFPSIG